jgi:hypothetical protein
MGGNLPGKLSGNTTVKILGGTTSVIIIAVN